MGQSIVHCSQANHLVGTNNLPYTNCNKKYFLDEINCTSKSTPSSEKGLTVPRSLIENFSETSTVFIMLGIFFGK